ncbi:MAG TPA: type II toxin-antitoxin system VapC family toxin [Candidatus Dormibacteraeota bacterium]|nr:type II toxin-antitoxin system VapC family toxin [Candidatus Dormibacteraeota bacterium]
MIVLDASAYCEALLRAPADPLRRRLADVSVVHVPDGFDIEVVNVLRRLWLKGVISADEGATEVATLGAAADVRRHPVVPLLTEMWRLRHNVTSYDAAYVALAQRLELPLVTADVKLGQAPDLPCVVEAF